jgi:hypothetical protein
MEDWLRALLAILLLAAALCSPPAEAALARGLPPPADTRVSLQRQGKVKFQQIPLYMALKKLGQAAGVTISCGRNAGDWQTRDIPVTVYADGTPLETLLRALADATQLRVRTEAEGDKAAYRIDEDPAVSDSARSYLQALAAWQRAEKSWEWDCVARLKDVPSETFSQLTYCANSVKLPLSHLVAAPALPLSHLIADLGPDVKATILSGRPIRLDYAELPASKQTLLKNLVDAIMCLQDEMDPSYAITMTDEMWRAVRLTVFAQESDIEFYLYNSGRNHGEGFNLISIPAYDLGWESPLAPVQPEVPPATPGLVKINPWEPGNDDMLTTRLTVPVPEGKKPSDLAAPDFLAAVSRATGYAVILEDFVSQSSGQYFLQDLAGKEVNVAAILANVGRIEPGVDWSVQHSEKLIVGCCSKWVTEKKENMLPGSYLASIRSKMDGDGLDLDDCLGILFLPQDQRSRWIRTRDLKDLTIGFPFDKKLFWPLYYSLNATEKKQAASAEGLSLGKLGQARLQAAFDRAIDDTLRSGIAREDAVNDRVLVDLASKPSAWPHLVIKLVESDFVIRRGDSVELSRPAHSSSLVVSGVVDGAPVEITCLGPGALPVYSSAREACIISRSASEYDRSWGRLLAQPPIAKTSANAPSTSFPTNDPQVRVTNICSPRL